MDNMKLLVNKLPDTPEQCVFSMEPPANSYTYPCKCRLKLNTTDYDYGLSWSVHSWNNCVLYKNKPCPYLQVLYGSVSW